MNPLTKRMKRILPTPVKTEQKNRKHDITPQQKISQHVETPKDLFENGHHLCCLKSCNHRRVNISKNFIKISYKKFCYDNLYTQKFQLTITKIKIVSSKFSCQ